ncbi:hypothetical protein GJAV_G00084530 [Gymnothorax javanicus]|nr:hypothetical protein GJAV_G00084530 [Gymnothorax javanicus]
MTRIQTQATTTLFILSMLAGCQGEQVICLLSEDCLLPCSFKPGVEEVIQWRKHGEHIYSFYSGSSQSPAPDSPYKGRASLFEDLITQGNASLLVKGIQISDEGVYSCYAGTVLGTREVFFHVQVIAPPSVSIERTDDGVVCVSHGSYPRPNITWSTDPPTAPNTLQTSTTATQDPQGLYLVHSRAKILSNLSVDAYICSVSVVNIERTGSLRQQGDIHREAGQILSIPCPVNQSSHQEDFTLTWIFNRAGNSSLILRQDHGKASPVIQPRWERWVQGISKDGTLLLERPQDTELSGTYSCLFSASGTQQQVDTNVIIEGGESVNNSGHTIAVAVSIIAIIAVITIALIMAWKMGLVKRPRQPHKANNTTDTRLQGHRDQGEEEDKRSDMLEPLNTI